jgi:hypothetical protein
MMSVYFIRAGDSDQVKIGYSESGVEKRLECLQPGNALVLTIDALIVGDMGIEQYLHKTLRRRRIRGEWFSIAQKELADITRPMLAGDGSRVIDSGGFELSELIPEGLLSLAGYAVNEWGVREVKFRLGDLEERERRIAESDAEWTRKIDANRAEERARALADARAKSSTKPARRLLMKQR